MPGPIPNPMKQRRARKLLGSLGLGQKMKPEHRSKRASINRPKQLGTPRIPRY